MEIEELPDLKVGWDRAYEYQDVPLLDYVWEVANKFLPSVEDTDIGMMPAESIAPAIFANRYAERNLTIEERYKRAKDMGMCNTTFERYSQSKHDYRPLDTRFKDEYLKSEEVLETLNSYRIDVSKFWYLSLFIKDMVLDKCVNAMPAKTPDAQIQELIDKIMELDLSSNKNAELIFKQEGKHQFSIADKSIIKEIGVALTVYKKLMKDNGLNSGQLDLKKMLNEKVTIDNTPMYALFTKIMKSFLTPYTAIPPYPKSIDKMLLISRMIKILGLSDDERFYQEYDLATNEKRNFLKNLIRRYEDYKYTTMGNIYMG